MIIETWCVDSHSNIHQAEAERKKEKQECEIHHPSHTFVNDVDAGLEAFYASGKVTPLEQIDEHEDHL